MTNGWLILNKPSGITSAKAVAIVKKRLGVKKIGHAGTLDPLAFGVLPLAIGEATKLMRLMMLEEKEYIFTVKWGVSTDTADLEGKVTNVSDKIPTRLEILNILPEFIGDIMQVPPIYSAIKVDGKRAYDLARKGEDFALKPRLIRINSFELLQSEGETSQFKISCGKGTYVRSLAVDIASKLGTFAHITSLLRSKLGKFELKDAILLEKLETMVYKDHPSTFLLQLEEVLDDIPGFHFSLAERKFLSCGRELTKHTGLINGQIVALYHEKKIFGLGEIVDNIIKPIRIIHN